MPRLQAAESDGPWLLVFCPIYAAASIQLILHCKKVPDARGRRPGFPIGIPHLLLLVISLKLDGVMGYQESSWANILWPLWGLSGFVGASLLFGLSCGVPLLLRRDVQSHVTYLLMCTLILLIGIFVPGLLACVRITMWLDGDLAIHAVIDPAAELPNSASRATGYQSAPPVPPPAPPPVPPPAPPLCLLRLTAPLLSLRPT